MLRKLFIIVFLLSLAALKSPAQEENVPVKWSLEVKSVSRNLLKDDQFNAFLSAEIEKGWHLYALEKIEGGPIPTRITIAGELPFELGKIEAPKPIEVDDAAFGVTTKFYEEAVRFTLPIKVLQSTGADAAQLQIKVRFQICNDEMCLPPKTIVVKTSAEGQEAVK
jgi:thiol:disulfide interchange protein DsbD